MDAYRSWQDPTFIEPADRYSQIAEYRNHYHNGPATTLDQCFSHDLDDFSAMAMDIEPDSLERSNTYRSPWSVPSLSTSPLYTDTPGLLPPNEIGQLLAWNHSERQKAGSFPPARASDVKRRIPSSSEMSYMGYGPYISKAETERKFDNDLKRRMCADCGLFFDGLRSLEEHARSDSHKAWACVDCGKMYGLRTTYQRHRRTHKDGAHICAHCQETGKHKVFKRKDHLNEHVRNCHRGSSNATSLATSPFDYQKRLDQRMGSASSEASSFGDLMHKSMADHGGDYGFSESPMACSMTSSFVSCAEKEKSTPKQQEAMKHIVRSLGDVLGRRDHKLIKSLENLESSLNSMSGAKMESVAEGMAELALVKTLLSKDSDLSCARV